MDFRLMMKAVEESGLSVWIRDSPSLFAFWFILSWHAIGMGMLVGASLIINLRILGVARDLPLMPLKGLYRIIWPAFWIQVVSGFLLLIAYPTKALTNLDFYFKLLMIGLAVAAMHTIRKRVFGDSNLSEPDMMSKGRTLAYLALLLWFFAITAGRLLAYTFTYVNYSG